MVLIQRSAVCNRLRQEAFLLTPCVLMPKMVETINDKDTRILQGSYKQKPKKKILNESRKRTIKFYGIVIRLISLASELKQVDIIRLPSPVKDSFILINQTIFVPSI